MGEASLETSPNNNMIQDMINSDNMNSTESTIPNILKSSHETMPEKKSDRVNQP